MAQGKKSILVYVDWISTFEKLEDDEAGRLIKHLFRYVNDLNPVSDRLTEIVFEPIKHQLKRDLKTYLDKCEKNTQNVRNRWNKENTNVCDRIKNDTNNTDTDNDTDNDIEKDKKEIKKVDKSTTPEKIVKFKESLYPFIGKYTKETVKDFFEYWSELNKSKTKMRWELQPTFEISKRLTTWSSKDNKFTKQEPVKSNVYE